MPKLSQRRRLKVQGEGDPDFTQASSKSAPAKVIPPPPPRRSPRGHKGSKKWTVILSGNCQFVLFSRVQPKKLRICRKKLHIRYGSVANA